MKKSTLYLIGGYVLTLILGFVSAPKQSFLIYAIALLIYTALYFGIAWFVKRFIVK